MQATAPPTCFGKSWEEKDAECAGGLDPLYTDPDNETNKRPQCRWFRSCGEVYRQSRASGLNTQTNGQPVAQQPLIPPGYLTKPFQAPGHASAPAPWQNMANTIKALAAVPPVPMVPPQPPHISAHVPVRTATQPQPSFTLPPYHPQQQQQQQQMVYQQPVNPYAVQMVPPPYAAVPHYVPMNYAMPGTQVPSFLTVPESPGQSWKARLAFSLIRGVAKAFGMIIANFFDHTPIVPWNPPPPPPQVPPPSTPQS